MRIETGLINRKGQQFCELPGSAAVVVAAAEKSRAKKNRRRQRKPMQAAIVQKLFNACKEVFSGSEAVPSPSDVERLRLILDTMTPADVGLNQDIPLFRKIGTEGAPPITYLHLYECSKFSIGIFCLPPSGVIPLHNHPGMTVFSKLLFGSMHIKSYDWADIPRTANEIVNPSHFQRGVRLAKVKVDDVFTAPCNTSILYPAAGGNMHRFTAITSCAVLDVLGPPYADSEGRHCTYYRDFPYARFSGDMELELGSEEGEVYVWLEETEKPCDFFVVGDKYRGPKIVEN